MKLKVQRIEGGFAVGGSIDSLKEAKEDSITLVEEGPFVYEAAIILLKACPKFNEVIINTKLTDDGENNH